MARKTNDTTEETREKSVSSGTRELLPYTALSILIHITLIVILMTINMGTLEPERVAFVDLVDVPRAVELLRPRPGVLESGKTHKAQPPATPKKRREKIESKSEKGKNREILKGKVPDLPVNPELPPEKAFPQEAPPREISPEKKTEKTRTRKETKEKGSSNTFPEKSTERGKGDGRGEEKIPDIKEITPSLGKMVIAATRKEAKGKGNGTGDNVGSENRPKKEGGFSETAQGGTVLTPLNSPSIQYISYFASIKRKIELVWQYPFDAIQRGIQGETVVDFAIRKDGSLQKVALVQSSGFKLLDGEAVEAIRKAAPFGPIPSQYKIDILNIRAHFIYEMHYLNVK